MEGQISRREILLGLGIFIAVSVLSVSLSGYIKEQQLRRYILVEQSLKVTEADKLAYGVSTNVGNILVYGAIKAVDHKAMPEIKGEYSVIDRIEEHYNLHYRTESYSCGKSTCEREVPYYSWDYAGESDLSAGSYNVIDTKVGNLCQPSTHWADLSSLYIGHDRHDGSYSYPGGLFGDVRYHWELSDTDHTGSVFMRAFNGRITDPFGGSCLSYYDGKAIQQVVDDYQPNDTLITWLFIGLVILVISIYSYFAYEDDIC